MNDQPTTQDRIYELAQNIQQNTGCGWYTAWNLAVKVLVQVGDLHIQEQR